MTLDGPLSFVIANSLFNVLYCIQCNHDKPCVAANTVVCRDVHHQGEKFKCECKPRFTGKKCDRPKRE